MTPPTTTDAHVVGPAGIADFESPAAEDVVVRASGTESGGQYDLLELTIPPGPGVTPLHIHHETDEAMLVLDGSLEVKLGEDVHDLATGAFAWAPQGLAHTYRNASAKPARVLFVLSPGNNWAYLRAAAEHGPVETDEDMERILPILEEHGVEVVGPPLNGPGATD